MTNYRKVMISESLYTWLKSESKSQGKRLGVFAREYFDEMLRKGIRYEQPVDYSVSVKDLRLDELKVLAGKSNMTVKQYVETYYNDSIMTPDEV